MRATISEEVNQAGITRLSHDVGGDGGGGGGGTSVTARGGQAALLRVLRSDGHIVGRIQLPGGALDTLSREATLQAHYAEQVATLRTQLARADDCACAFHAQALASNDTLQDYVRRCHELLAATTAAMRTAERAVRQSLLYATVRIVSHPRQGVCLPDC
jgi:hypothetical protein